MTWTNFIFFAVGSIICWILASVLIYKQKYKKLSNILFLLGIGILLTFIILFWLNLKRPPFRTIGETRLWYSFFITLVGYITYKRWKYPWLIIYTSIVGIVFLIINLVKPEIHSQTLMPALQSLWFIPHVTAYIISYSMLGAATIAGIILLRKIENKKLDIKLENLIDNLVYIGFGFLALGLLMGCLWAKEAWGHYWSWDPKETWAFLTSTAYLVYIHSRLHKINIKISLWILIISLILLCITWLGIDYIPSAQSSIHVY